MTRNAILSTIGSLLLLGTVATYVWLRSNDQTYRFIADDPDSLIEEIIPTAGRGSYVRGFLLYECGTWPFIDVDIEYPQELKVGEDAKVYLDIDAGISHCEEDENTINLVTEHSSLERDLAIKLKSAAFDVSQVERIANAGTSFPLEFEWAIAPRRNRRGVLELDFSQLQGVISLEENAVRGLTLNRDSSELEVFEATLEVEVYTDIPIKESTVDLITLAFIALGTVLNSPLLLDIYRRRSSRASPESG